jgi:iron complex outermembrane receptor protein
MKKLLCILCVFFLHAGLAFAAESAEKRESSSENIEKQEMVVTASKLPQTQGNVTQLIDVISQQDIDRMVLGNRNLAELLMYQPGISVSVLSRNDANWGSYGGLGPKYNTYLLDGLPIDSFVDPQSLDAWALQRIETQHGPASVMYPNYLSQDFAGNQSALAGTTNFLLKERVDRPLTRLYAGGGSWNTWDARAYHQNKVGDLHFFLGGQYESSDYANYGADPSWLNMLDDPDHNKAKFYGKGTYHIGGRDDHKISLFAHHAQHKGDAGRPNRGINHKYTTLNGSYYVAPTDTLTLQIKGGYRYYDRSWQEDNYPSSLALRSNDGVKQTILPVDASLAWSHGGGGLLTFGVDYQYASYKTTTNPGSEVTTNDAKMHSYGVYAQEEFTLGRLVLRGGVRFNHTKSEYDIISSTVPQEKEQDWNKALWSAGARYNFSDQFALFANVGTSFLAPAAKQVGGTIPGSARGIPGYNGQLPNPGLNPEEGIGADMGIESTPLKGLRLTARAFYNRIDDAIVDQSVSHDPSQTQSVNAGTVTSYGLELGMRQQLVSWLGWFANYTYTHSKNEDPDNQDQDGTEVPFVPEHMGNVGLDAQLPYKARASLYAHLAGSVYDSLSKSGRTKMDPYQVVNFSAVMPVFAKNAFELDLRLDLYNILNQHYEMPWQFQDPGFSFMFGVEARF